jgi:ABC-2 type transport system permease protein
VLFGMTVSRYVWSRRTLIIALLFSLPTLLVLLAVYVDPQGSGAQGRTAVWRAESEYRVVFWLIPHALIPLVALLYASGMIQDEIEEQTLTYLLIRPMARWTIYTTKLLAVFVVVTVLSTAFTTAAYLAIHWGADNLWGDVLPGRVWKTSALFALSLSAYSAIFGLVSLVVRKALMVGVAYIFLFEVVFANADFVVRRMTVIYYFRVLARRWLGVTGEDWSINLYTSPGAKTCVLVLLGASLLATVAAAMLFTVREFRQKTPEGR